MNRGAGPGPVPAPSREASHPRGEDLESKGTRGGGREYPCFCGASAVSGLRRKFRQNTHSGQRTRRVDRTRANSIERPGLGFRPAQDPCRRAHAGMGDRGSVHSRPILSSCGDLAALAFEAAHCIARLQYIASEVGAAGATSTSCSSCPQEAAGRAALLPAVSSRSDRHCAGR